MSATSELFPELARRPARRTPGNAFVNCGIAGFAVAAIMSHLLILRVGLSPGVQLICAVTAAAGLLGTALLAKVLTGEDGFVFYRDATTALLLVALVLRLLRQPVLSYMDITILGAGLFQAFGRVGCLLVGCCHGLPSRFGLRYTHNHAQTGFPSYLIGVRLFPIQAVEALCVFAIVFAGGATLLSPPAPAPGSVTAFFALAYAFARIFIEFFRGDVARPVYADFSQAQWISLFLSAAILLAERFGVLPATPWHAIVPLTIAAAMLCTQIYRGISKSRLFELIQPQHIRELADFLALRPSVQNLRAWPSAVPPSEIALMTTTAGLRLSSTELLFPDRSVFAVTFSRPCRPLIPRQARRIAKILSRLTHSSSPCELLPASHGVFHLLFPLSREASKTCARVSRN